MNEFTYQAWCPVCCKVTTYKNGKCTEHVIETRTASSTSECPVCDKVINQCECGAERRISITAEQYDSWVHTVELLQDVAESGVEHMAVGYVMVQISYRTWKEIQKWLNGRLEGEGERGIL